MPEPLKPEAGLLCKLGSIVVHAQEARADKGHVYDVVALDALLRDAEVVEWLSAMDALAMIPKKRD